MYSNYDVVQNRNVSTLESSINLKLKDDSPVKEIHIWTEIGTEILHRNGRTSKNKYI